MKRIAMSHRPFAQAMLAIGFVSQAVKDARALRDDADRNRGSGSASSEVFSGNSYHFLQLPGVCHTLLTLNLPWP